jgi:pimeloyl-ACP methyl ester carboxylesterase/DNA-binding CsgD family transcriptional regulator
MEQRIRFAPTPQGRVAYSILGRGRPLIVDVGWLFGMEVSWQDPAYRRFFTDLAGDRMVIRYDKIGTGNSDRDRGSLPLDLQVETVRLLAQHLELESFDLLGMCQGGTLMAGLAALHSNQVRRLVIYGSCARGADVAAPEIRESVVSLVRAHWGLGSRTLADIFIPHGTGVELQRFREQQRGSATPAVAAELLEDLHSTDVTKLLPRIESPTRVIHRRKDRVMVHELGRSLASAIPGAELVTLEGNTHLAWLGDSETVIAAIREFLAEEASPMDNLLTERELELAALVAEGLTNAEIAARLVISPRTADAHLEHIREKLGVRSRAQIAAWAVSRRPTR